MIPVITT